LPPLRADRDPRAARLWPRERRPTVAQWVPTDLARVPADRGPGVPPGGGRGCLPTVAGAYRRTVTKGRPRTSSDRTTTPPATWQCCRLGRMLRAMARGRG